MRFRLLPTQLGVYRQLPEGAAPGQISPPSGFLTRTTPVGVPGADEVTLKLTVISAPGSDGSGLLKTVVVVPAGGGGGEGGTINWLGVYCTTHE